MRGPVYAGCGLGGFKEVEYDEFEYIYEERLYFLSLLREEFKRKYGGVHFVYIFCVILYRRLLFSISGWLNKQGKKKRKE
jgi:hypothetical protein